MRYLLFLLALPLCAQWADPGIRFNFRSSAGPPPTDGTSTQGMTNGTCDAYPITSTIGGASVNYGIDDESTCGAATKQDQTSSYPELSGQFVTLPGAEFWFRVHLPAAGQYELRLASGAATGCQSLITIWDGGGAHSTVVNTSGTTVTHVSGRVFKPDWVGGQITINSVQYTVAAYVSQTEITIGTSAGTQEGQVLTYGNTTLLDTVANNVTTAGNVYIDATGVSRSTQADWNTNNAAKTLTFSTNVLRVKLGGAASSGYSCLNHLSVKQLPAPTPTRRRLISVM